MWPNPQETANLAIFTEEIHNRKLHFLCSVIKRSLELDVSVISSFNNIWYSAGGVLKNSAKFTRKHLYQILFNKFSSLRPATLLKKRLWHRCFPVNFREFLKNTFCNRTTPVAAFMDKNWNFIEILESNHLMGVTYYNDFSFPDPT